MDQLYFILQAQLPHSLTLPHTSPSLSLSPSLTANMVQSKKFRGVRQRHWGSWVSEIRHPLLYDLFIPLLFSYQPSSIHLCHLLIPLLYSQQTIHHIHPFLGHNNISSTMFNTHSHTNIFTASVSSTS